MLPASAKLMSADDHLIEPPHLWVDRVPAAHRDRCPRVVEVENGREAWLYEDELTFVMMGSCRALDGFPPTGDARTGSARFDEIRPGCYDPVERLNDMDIDGVWSQLCFPNYARFAGHRFFLNVKDQELGDVCLRAYNDYLLDEWCATDRERLSGAVILPLHDVDAAVAELRESWPKAQRPSLSRKIRPCWASLRSIPGTGTPCGPSPAKPMCQCACTSEARHGWSTLLTMPR